ncbi:T9SS type A sorting domain-containing protein [Flavobacterium phycosphaerae]|uniref:T9SS type A sorting domain-containing protein n=1 Tax=Flavobacterium phycosphaerae TaxID=2697515 RepID=UPI0013897D01|nr:T9SS type A sorting domain-containing protein [Flavobacterium phycosphaerae]
MKKIYSLLLLVISSVTFGQTFYSENMGTATGTLSIALNTFQNSSPIVYTGDADTRATTVSTGYANASGGRNVFFAAAGAKYFQIDGLNTSAYSAANLQLSFGYLTTTTTAQMTVEYSTDGSTWNPLTFTNNTTTSWTLVTIAGGVIPASATLSLKFTGPVTSGGMRLDDVKLSSVSASCTLALGTATTLCDAFTTGLDTYTVTIPYTGGGNAAYTVTPSSGTVGGDNPTTVAAGNITISGVTEATNFTATVTGGTCSLNASANSPECKSVNPLPYSETFPYAVGASLGVQQKWTNVNSGDDIVGAAGSLTYPGFTSSGNSVTFVGSGIDCFTPFTSTTSGAIYASFILNISDVTTSPTGETYFAGLTDPAKGYKARLFSKVTAGQYQLGLDAASTTTNYDATLRNPGDVVFVVMGYDFTSNTLSAWINPDLATLTTATPATLTNVPAAAITDLGGFILRQDGNTTTPTIIFDELRVADSLTTLLAVAQNNISGLKVYPNPVSNGVLFIETAVNATKTVTIYDVLGKQVINTTTADNAINVSALNGGVYVVKITEEGKTATKKLVIK